VVLGRDKERELPGAPCAGGPPLRAKHVLDCLQDVVAERHQEAFRTRSSPRRRVRSNPVWSRCENTPSTTVFRWLSSRRWRAVELMTLARINSGSKVESWRVRRLALGRRHSDRREQTLQSLTRAAYSQVASFW